MLFSNLIFAFVILFSSFVVLEAFTQTGYNIKDLTSTNSIEFASEVSKWILSNGVSNSVCSACVFTLPTGSCNLASDRVAYGGPVSLLGPTHGFAGFFTTYSGLGSAVTNSAMELDVFVWASTSVTIDVSTFLSIGFDLFNINPPGAVQQTCVSGNMYKYRAQALSEHSGDLNLIIFFVFPAEVTAVAIRNINIFPMPSTANSGYTNFPCNSPYQWDGSSCITCFAGCASCSSAGNGNCIGCKAGYYDYQNGYCQTTCDGIFAPVGSTNVCAKRCSTGFYWYHNNSCTASCPSPLVSSVDANNFDICSNPCYYLSGVYINQFLYPDKTCESTCNLPFVVRSPNICASPCENLDYFLATNGSCENSCDSPLSPSNVKGIKLCQSSCPTQYLYANGSCFASCSSPLIKIEIPDRKFCINPCSDPVNQYLYPNSTCKSTCPSPLSSWSEAVTKYCYTPCSSTQYLYPNGSCLPDCPSPLMKKEDPDMKFCINPCSDPVGQYLYPNSTCKSTCPSPLLSWSEDVAKYCYTPCFSTQYLYANVSCLSDCPSPLTKKEDSDMKFCINPCSDPVNQYLYPNSSCESSCRSPLFSRFESGVNYCWNPCDLNTEYLFDNSECSPQCDSLLEINLDPDFVQYCQNPCFENNTFLYPNGSCLSTCPDPLEEKAKNGVKYCINPCPNSSDYLYSDKSCSSQCLYPLSNRTEQSANFCFSPCDDFFYKNGSCLQICSPPYLKFQSYNVSQCLPPCEDSSKEYFYETEQTCKSTCTSPYESKKVDGVKVCFQISQLTPQEVEETESLVSSMKSQGQMTEAGMKAASALSSGNPSFAWLAGQASMLFYIRYINLNYTPKLKLLFSLQDASPFDFTVGINMPKGLKEELKDRELPEIFERYEIHSNFFYNSWDMLSSFLLILGIILVVSVVKIFTAKYSKVDRVLAGVLRSLKWNTLLMVICGSFGKVFFDASMQIQAGSADSTWEIFSIILAIFMIFVGLAILALNGKVVRDFWKSRNVKSYREEMEKKWENFELLFESCERSSLASIGCMGIFLGRTLLFNLIIANLYNYPLTQSVLINLITFGMIGYLISKRPLKNLLEFAQILLSEVFVLIVNACALIIAIMDHAQIEGKGLRNDLCNTIITIFSIFTSFNLAFLAIQVLIALFLFVRIIRRLKAQSQLHLRGISNALFFGNKENPAVEENNNGTKIPVQIRPQMREISHVTEDLNVTNITHQMNETENRQETSGIFIPHQSSNRRIIHASRKIRPTLSFLDSSAIEILPSEGSFHNNLSSISGVNQHMTLETNNRDSVVVRTVSPIKNSAQEKRDFGLPDTISQYRKMRNYLRRNRDRRQPE